MSGLAIDSIGVLGMLWRGEGDLFAFGMLEPNQQGVARLKVPADEIFLVQPDPLRQSDPREWPVLKTIRTSAEHETSVEL